MDKRFNILTPLPPQRRTQTQQEPEITECHKKRKHHGGGKSFFFFSFIGHKDYAFFKNLGLSHFKWCPSLPDIDIKCPEQTYRSRPELDKKSKEHKERRSAEPAMEKKR